MLTRTAFGDLVTHTLERRFRDVRLLHAGENGLVYLVRDPECHDERRAVRVGYPDDMGAQPVANRARFQRLAEIGLAVHHPNVARVYGTETFEDVTFTVMELAGPLRVDHLIGATRPPSLPRILSVLRELAAALDALHARHVVHGALRPSRVMLDATGHVKLTGMLLFADDAHPPAALTAAAVGDPAYMPPEQWHAVRGTPAMDVYAVGILAYELFTGEPRVLRDDSGTPAVRPLVIPASRRLREDLSLSVNATLQRATAADPAQRYATVGAFVADLARPHSRPSGESLVTPPLAPHRRSPWVLGLLLAGVLILLGLLVR